MVKAVSFSGTYYVAVPPTKKQNFDDSEFERRLRAEGYSEGNSHTTKNNRAFRSAWVMPQGKSTGSYVVVISTGKHDSNSRADKFLKHFLDSVFTIPGFSSFTPKRDFNADSGVSLTALQTGELAKDAAVIKLLA